MKKAKIIEGGNVDNVERGYERWMKELTGTVLDEQYRYANGVHTICVFYDDEKSEKGKKDKA